MCVCVGGEENRSVVPETTTTNNCNSLNGMKLDYNLFVEPHNTAILERLVLYNMVQNIMLYWSYFYIGIFFTLSHREKKCPPLIIILAKGCR